MSSHMNTANLSPGNNMEMISPIVSENTIINFCHGWKFVQFLYSHNVQTFFIIQTSYD